MHGPSITKHFQSRAKQRGFNPTVITILLEYGENLYSKGSISSLVFTKNSFDSIRSDYGFKILKMCEKFRNAYIIMSDDGVLITIARGYRRAVH